MLAAFTATPTGLEDDEACAALTVTSIFDLGDAPDTYGTTGATAAKHEIIPGWMSERGDVVIYTLTILNEGPDVATAVTVTDRLPASVTYVSDDGAGAYDQTNGVWTIGNVPVGKVSVLKINATVD